MAEPAQAGALSEPERDGRALRGVIFDWGGVLTGPIGDTVLAWLEAEQIDRASYSAVVMPWIQLAYGSPAGGDQRDDAAALGDSPVHQLERGEIPDAEFERLLAARLTQASGHPVEAAGLLARMFGSSFLDAAMHEVVRQLRSAGLRIGLLSNSWGSGGYPRHLFGDLFDDVVISGEVGMRKPEARIFALAARRLGLGPADCVFIDDVEGNVAAAQALGFAGVHHRNAQLTARQLSQLLGVSLAGAS